MKVYLNEISGIPDAIITMFMSKRTWTRELENRIRFVCDKVLTKEGRVRESMHTSETGTLVCIDKYINEYKEWMNKLVKWGCNHITMLRYIDMSVTVEGLHRAGQDDWDAHAMRYNNRIIRSSTRLATFGNEISKWYQGKIIPTDAALDILGISIPEKFKHDEKTWVKTTNGYIDETMKDDKDVRRGLYMLSIPSNFIFKVNLTELAHVYKERNINSGANPEVIMCCEEIANQLESFQPLFTRELLLDIKN